MYLFETWLQHVSALSQEVSGTLFRPYSEKTGLRYCWGEHVSTVVTVPQVFGPDAVDDAVA